MSNQTLPGKLAPFPDVCSTGIKYFAEVKSDDAGAQVEYHLVALEIFRGIGADNFFIEKPLFHTLFDKTLIIITGSKCQGEVSFVVGIFSRYPAGEPLILRLRK
jgi:hypothetical protein